MNKILLLAAIALILTPAAFAQINLKDYSVSSYTKPKGDTTPSLVTATRKNNSYVEDMGTPFPLPPEDLISARPYYYYYNTTYDSSEAYFFVEHIDHHNASQYEFRVRQNHSTTILPWTNITHFVTGDQVPKSDSKEKEMALLGGYKTGFGNYLGVDIRRKNSDSVLSYAYVFWRKTQPVLLNIYTSNELNEFLRRLSISQLQKSSLTRDERKKWKQRYPPDEIDSASALPKKLILPNNDNNLIFYLKGGPNQRRVLEYQLIKDGSPYTEWQKNEFDGHFIWLKNLPPGEYRLEMRYLIQPQHLTSYPFRIKPAWHQTTAFKLVAGALIAAFFGFIILLWRGRRQKQLLLAEQQKKGKLETEIKALHAQLNPHFVFNALNSIQGLINKGEIDKANNYLADFANLMRDVLNGNNNENNELYREIQTLESYMKLEQLRFQFVYKIDTGKITNLSEIQIPSLLLQPLVENAVKHGISALQDKGRIEIVFSQSNNDMQVRITDNGKGFDIHHASQGYGLKLTRQRIALINEILKSPSIVMDIDSGAGTTVILTFKNWLG
ncbi:histidine kinase [Flavitalea sp. BT771]|uniref:sensor histidine kinase n=1 Tax=Flavitalea sp. BT771 TaxID=3063329 RepID=UPI0026E3C630|nr:histidine kinase [Flavitalea sp. BT771]MDO6434459.1 histidine kinase [Flavitalea sp. BT771]MDV6223359.1 histidine kinase [Flavitalea sp. BT771]